MSLGPNPFVIFNEWFMSAEKAGVLEPNAMVLSTIDKNKHPQSRVVLLKRSLDEVFYFFTNYNSEKAQELLQHPVASLNFHWRLPFHRQVRICGKVKQSSAEISDEYFSTRPRGSQIGAWSSPQSQKIQSSDDIKNLVASFDEKFKDRPVPRPEFWGGFGVTAESFEFWQEGEFRLHTRWRYQLQADKTWKAELLAP